MSKLVGLLCFLKILFTGINISLYTLLGMSDLQQEVNYELLKLMVCVGGLT